MTSSFTGIFTALLTPFTEKNLVDYDAFSLLVENQIKHPISGLVVCGTTGEAASLTLEEQSRLIAHVCKITKKKMPIIVGASSNNTEQALSLAQNAEKQGADALLITAPYYVLPPQEGIIAHFTAIHDAVNIPIFIYNNPGRTVTDISDATINTLSFLPRIIGVKDSSGDISRITSLQKILENPLCLLSGDDATCVDFMSKGGQGCISVMSNLFPDLCHLFFDNTQSLEKLREKKSLYEGFMKVYNAIFADSNPMGVKYASSLLHAHRPHVRLPLVMPSLDSRERIKQAMHYLLRIKEDIHHV